MTIPVPYPSPDEVPVLEGRQQQLSVGQEYRVTFEATQAGVDFRLATVGISKVPGTTYEIRIDGETVYGPAPIPPTDVDDLTVTFLPTYVVDATLTVIVSNVSGSTATYSVQPLGWEER